MQGLPSSQTRPLPAWQLPPTQPSPLVQALPSLQGWLLELNWQPCLGSQVSVVQGLASSQLVAEPGRHWLWAQLSPAVQALPSLHGAVLAKLKHPLTKSQESSVHGLLSEHCSGLPGWQLPAWQASPAVQALLSLQLAVLGVYLQPAAGSQVSLVQGLLSSQTTAAPGTH